MDVCFRSFGFRLSAESPLGFRRGDVSAVGFRVVLRIMGPILVIGYMAPNNIFR